MDVLDLLKSEHARFKIFIRDFQNTKDNKQRKQILGNILSELDLHFYSEETVFYPAFSKYDESKDLIEDCYKDHYLIKKILDLFTQPNVLNRTDLEQQFTILAQEVDNHFLREENELFPVVRKLTKTQERERIGRLIQAARLEREVAA